MDIVHDRDLSSALDLEEAEAPVVVRVERAEEDWPLKCPEAEFDFGFGFEYARET